MKSSYLTLPDVARVLRTDAAVVAAWFLDGSGGQRFSAATDTIAELSLVHWLLRQGMTIPRELSASLRLLVIDDEPAMLRSTARLLKRGAPHLEVSLAEGAARGLDRLCERVPDAVLVDVHMPGVMGLELCAQIKQTPLTAGVAVMVFSGRRDHALEADALRAGAVALLDKPPNVRELLDVLERSCLATHSCAVEDA